MFGLSFAETALIALVALLVIDPKDLPAIGKTLRGWWREINSATSEIKHTLNEVMHEADPTGDMMGDTHEDAEAIARDVKYIRDQNGKLQRVYDLSDFTDEQQKQLKTDAKP